MSKQESSVTPLAGSQPESTDPLVRAESAMSAAIGEIERLDGNGHTLAELIEAREDIRQQYRDRARETGQTAHKAAMLPAFKISDMLYGTEYELGRYIIEAQDGNRRRAIREALLNARALTDALGSVDHEELADFTAVQLARMADTLVRRAQHLEAEGRDHE